MPANDDLRRGFPMLRSDADEHRLAEQSAPSEGTPGFRSDPALVVKLSQGLLLKARMKLDLVDCWRDARLCDDSFQMTPIEIRDADRADPAFLLETDERFPTFDIAVDPRPRPMDQVQVEGVTT